MVVLIVPITQLELVVDGAAENLFLIATNFTADHGLIVHQDKQVTEDLW